MLRQQKMWDFLIGEKISLREYYYLYKLFNKEDIPKDFHSRLTMKGLSNNKGITDRGISIVNKIDSLFLKSNSKTITSMGSDYFKKIGEYRELFPKVTLASGKPARCSIKNLEKAFVWFFSNYNYTWEEILQATKLYIKENDEGRGKYMKTSQYFIRKDDTSTLSDMCELIRGGIEEIKNIKTKVV